MKSLLLFAALGGLIFLSSCNKGPLCQVKNGKEGIITADVKDLEDICFTPSQDQFLIRSDSEYNAIIQHRPSTDCQSEPLPSIDFTQNSLLGCRADASGCEGGMVRHAERNDSNKKITYTVETYACGNCEMLMFSLNAVLIPKVPGDYSVDFNVIEK